MNCVNCGAPLPPKSGICRHCSALNEIDLRGIFDVARRAPDETRICPCCDEPLESLDLGLGASFLIERCRTCLGLFFDPGELDFVVREKIGEPTRIDRQRLEKILDEECPQREGGVRYLRCPTCRELMNRKTYGAKSGIVTDECKAHGVWLNGGELRQILKWTKVGGEVIEQQRQKDEARAAKSRKKLDQALKTSGSSGSSTVDDEASHVTLGVGAIEAVISLLFTILRR